MIEKFNNWVLRNIQREGDSEEILLIKRIWWVCLSFAVPAIAILGVIIWLRGQFQIALIMFIFSLFWLISMIIFRFLRRGITWFGLSSQLALIVFSFVTVYLMGGILSSGGMIFYGLVGPVYALVFPDKKRAILIFAIYLATVVSLLVLDPIQALLPLTYKDNLLLFVLNFIVCSVFWYAAIFFFANQRTNALYNLRLEEAKSNNLLLNILPAPIVEILKVPATELIAEKLDNVSILFADLVGFTRQASKMPPEEIILFLNETFTYFDKLTEAYHMEKIKTIGDCYMAVAGAPIPDPHHAEAAANMALKIQEYARANHLQFRIGIHSGSVVAGVIGVKKFSYDLWGDSVNMASRLESNAPAGEIFISESTYQLIKDKFNCHCEGEKDLKGIGRVKIWNLKS